MEIKKYFLYLQWALSLFLLGAIATSQGTFDNVGQWIISIQLGTIYLGLSHRFLED